MDFIVITGTRRDSLALRDAMEALCIRLAIEDFGGIVVHGDCPTGADRAAEAVWGEACWPIPAPWEAFKRIGRVGLAGPVRNTAIAGAVGAMLAAGLTGKGFAFPDLQSQGTRDCVSRLRGVGLEVEVRTIGSTGLDNP